MWSSRGIRAMGKPVDEIGRRWISVAPSQPSATQKLSNFPERHDSAGQNPISISRGASRSTTTAGSPASEARPDGLNCGCGRL